MKKLLVLLCLLTLGVWPLSTTAWGWATREGFEKLLTTWMNNNADDLVSLWGPPESVYTMSDGKKVLTYMINTGSGGSAVPIGSTYVYRAREWYCKVSFTVNNSNLISNWRYEGNNCRANAPKEKPPTPKKDTQPRQPEIKPDMRIKFHADLKEAI